MRIDSFLVYPRVTACPFETVAAERGLKRERPPETDEVENALVEERVNLVD